MKTEITGMYNEERALFMAHDILVSNSEFDVGESPLKHSRDVEVSGVTFKGKYPLWYSNNITVHDTVFEAGARAAIWYTNGLYMHDTKYHAVKSMRRCSGIKLENVEFTDAHEMLWTCKDISLKNIRVTGGDYLCMNSSDVTVEGLELKGNYSFDGCSGIKINNSKIIGRDAFWNCENVTVENCVISGEYIGWNSKNLTFIDCELESLQGFCYIDGLVMKNCSFKNTTLAFEYSSVDIDINGGIDSIINPIGGIIRTSSIGELILDPDKVNVKATRIWHK